jgi:hypothetical protein
VNHVIRFLRQLDRRWIFLAMFLAVAIPILVQKTYRELPTQTVRDAFDIVEDLAPGGTVLVPIDYDPGSEAELGPMAVAFVRHLCLKEQKIIFMTLWPNGGPMIDSVIDNVVEGEFAAQYHYGRNYVNLGYKSGLEMVINVIATDLRGQFKTDKRNNLLDDLEITRAIRSVGDVQLIASASAGTPGAKEWVQYAGRRLGVPVIAGATGIQSTQLYAYYPQQLQGLLPAIKGAAEYEALLGAKYPQYAAIDQTDAIRKMAPQLWGHLLVIAMIILGNFIYFMDRRRGRP